MELAYSYQRIKKDQDIPIGATWSFLLSFAPPKNKSMAPLAILEGNSVADALNKLARGTTVEALIGQLLNGKNKELTQ